ncbi:hypothetical protein D1007_45774 [Hordeum vulgare]|nr:hypothetical protein D1007_45774 [Hordeum vulgare]
MEPSKMELVEVPEDPLIRLDRKINSATRQTCRVKAKAAKEEKLKKRLATGGPTGGNGRGGRGGWRCRGRCSRTGSHTVHMGSLLEPYKPLYYYAAKKLGTPAGTVPYIVDVNAAPLFFEYSLR